MEGVYHWLRWGWWWVGELRGMYVSRTLSFSGAEFEVVQVPLGDSMTVNGGGRDRKP